MVLEAIETDSEESWARRGPQFSPRKNVNSSSVQIIKKKSSLFLRREKFANKCWRNVMRRWSNPPPPNPGKRGDKQKTNVWPCRKLPPAVWGVVDEICFLGINPNLHPAVSKNLTRRLSCEATAKTTWGVRAGLSLTCSGMFDEINRYFHS